MLVPTIEEYNLINEKISQFTYPVIVDDCNTFYNLNKGLKKYDTFLLDEQNYVIAKNDSKDLCLIISDYQKIISERRKC